MKNINVLWLILDLIFLIIFNALFFVLGGVEHTMSVWISYAFIHFAYFMLLTTPKLIREGKSSAVFGFSLYSISSAYFLIEFVTGIIFILVSLESYKIAFLIQLCIAGLFVIILISHMIANEHTADAEEKRHSQIAYVKDASTKLKGLLENISDKEAKKKAEKVYDVIYSSPVKSHTDLIQMEERILASIDELENAVSTGNKGSIISLANTLLSVVNERNMRLRNLN
jgi:signal transduction histidine kinase